MSLLPDLRQICIQGKDPPSPAAETIFHYCISSISLKKPKASACPAGERSRRLSEKQWASGQEKQQPGASTDGLVLQTGEDSAPQGPTTPLGFSPAATYQAQKPKSRVTKTGLKASGKDNFTLNYI